MLHMTHTETVELRQRLARLQQAQDDATEEQIKANRFYRKIGERYNLVGLRYKLDQETGEIYVFPEPVRWKFHKSINAVAMQNLEWEGEDETVLPQAVSEKTA